MKKVWLRLAQLALSGPCFPCFPRFPLAPLGPLGPLGQYSPVALVTLVGLSGQYYLLGQWHHHYRQPLQGR